MDELKINAYLTFVIKEENYALNVANVLHILEMPQITKIPHAPDYMSGVMNLRGEVLPVIDTSVKFKQEETEITNTTSILVLDVKVNDIQVKLGAIVDNVLNVIDSEEKDILPPPSIGQNYQAQFITGLLPDNSKFIMILDAAKILSVDELSDLKQLSEQ